MRLEDYPVILRALNGDQEAIDYLRLWDPEHPLMTIKDMETMGPEEYQTFWDRYERLDWLLDGRDKGEPEPIPGAHVSNWQKAQAYDEAHMELWSRSHVWTFHDGKSCRWADKPKGVYKPMRPRSAHVYDWYAMTDKELKDWLETHKDWQEKKN